MITLCVAFFMGAVWCAIMYFVKGRNLHWGILAFLLLLASYFYFRLWRLS